MNGFSFEDPASALLNVRDSLTEVMASEHASAEVLDAMGHVDAALRSLRIREERVAAEEERARLDRETASAEEDIRIEQAARAALAAEGLTPEEYTEES